MKTKFILHGGFTKGQTKEDNSDFYGEILKDTPKVTKVLLVLFAKDEERIPNAIVRIKAEFNQINGNLIFDVATPETFLDQLKWANIVFFSGGTTLKLLPILKNYTELCKLLVDKVIAGESADANVLCKYFYSPSSDLVGEGLGILPLKIIPHFKSEYTGKLDNVGKDLELLCLPEYEFKVYMI